MEHLGLGAISSIQNIFRTYEESRKNLEKTSPKIPEITQVLTAPLAAVAFVANHVSTAAPRASGTLAANGGTSMAQDEAPKIAKLRHKWLQCGASMV